MMERSEMKEVYKKRVLSSPVSAALAVIVPTMKWLLKRKSFFPVCFFFFLRSDESLHTLCFSSDTAIFYLNTELSGANSPAI